MTYNLRKLLLIPHTSPTPKWISHPAPKMFVHSSRINPHDKMMERTHYKILVHEQNVGKGEPR